MAIWDQKGGSTALQNEAAAIGRSDKMVYAALADGWIKRGLSTRGEEQTWEQFYQNALAASDMAIQAEPMQAIGYEGRMKVEF